MIADSCMPCLVCLLALGLGVGAVSGAGSAAAPEAPAFTLARDGQPACTIVTAERPAPAAQLAALEIQFHVLRISGAELPIRRDTEPAAGPRILVGESAAARALGFDAAGFAPQEYLVHVSPDTVVLLGRDWQDTEAARRAFGRPMSCGDTLASTRHRIDYWTTAGLPGRSTGEIELPGIYDEQGTCYAAYDFIERFLDVRWYGPSETAIVMPSHATLAVAPAEIRRAPALKLRDALWAGNWPFMQGQWGPVTRPEVYLFWRRLRLGGERWAANHTFHTKTVQTMFTDPAYQAQGKGRGSQLCYTNPKLIEQVAQMARDFFDGKTDAPEGWKAVGDYFAIVPDDNAHFCTCAACRELLAAGRGRGTGQFSSGTVSNYFFSFVNAVARDVRTTHPGKYIATLAYWNYAWPPEGFALEPNVSIAPCLHTCLYAIHEAVRENDMQLYRAWLGQTSAPMFLWNYYHHPMEPALIDRWKCFPNIMVHNTAESMRMFIRDGVRGIFICGEQDMLEAYVMAKIWDDPALDVDALLDEFFRRYFGNAAEPMKSFYLRIEAIASDPANYPPPYYRKDGIDWKRAAWETLGTAERMQELRGYIVAAQSLARTDLERRRVALWHDALWKWMEQGRAEAP